MTGHATGERLSSYLDDELDAAEARRLAEHLERCGSCRQRLDGLRRVMGDLKNLGESSPPPGLGLRLQQRLAREVPPLGDFQSRGSKLPRLFFQPAVLGTLGVILALGIIMVVFIQALEKKQAGSGGFGSGSPGSAEVKGVDPRAAEVAGRNFELLGGIWIERDLTVAEVAEAHVVERSELLDDESTAAELREILGRLDGQVTLRVGDEIWRVSAAN